jgi:hypothetical protein
MAMVAELHLCDLLLLKVERGVGCSVTDLARRQRTVLADLSRLLPSLAALHLGELDARVVPDVQGYRLRLLLRLRQRSLLLDPKCSKPTLEGEAAMLRDDIERMGLRVLRAVRELKGAKAKATGGPDLMHELLVRRARQDWRLMVEHRQIDLPFPDCPRFYADEVAHRVDGVVLGVNEHLVVMRSVDVSTIDAHPRIVARLGRLCIRAPGTGGTERGFDAIRCGRPRSQVVRLQRCALTSAIVGAIDDAED